METKIIEVESPNLDLWGKFMVGIFDGEWERLPIVDTTSRPLLGHLGWTHDHFLAVDLSVGHGAIFHKIGDAREDIAHEGIYFCPMFTSFLTWLRKEGPFDLDALPDKVVLPEYGKFVHGDMEHYEDIPHECLNQVVADANTENQG